MLKVIHIAGEGSLKKRERKLSEKEMLHRASMEAIASRRIIDRARAEKLFAPETKEIEDLRQKLNTLRQQMC